MKAKCEEIVIERYLKGEIGRKLKNDLLCIIHGRSDNEQFLTLLFNTLNNDNQETLRILRDFAKIIMKQIIADNKDIPLKSLKAKGGVRR